MRVCKPCNPTPVSAEIAITFSCRSALSNTEARASSSNSSILFQTSRSGTSEDTPSFSSVRSTSVACSSLEACAMSRTWIMISALNTSSNVARNAATNSVGKSEINPTVSDRMTRCPVASVKLRIVGSSVANNISFAITCAPVRRLKRVDLPAFVYPIKATIGNGTLARAARCSARVFTTLSNCRRSRSN